MSELSLTILPETPGDALPIERLHERTFGPGRYARSAYRLREGRGHALDLSFTDEQRARLQQVSAITLGLPARNATPAVHRSIHRRRHGFASTDVVVQRGARQLGGTRWTPDAT